MAKATVKIQYCGGWGYKRYALALQKKLRDEFTTDDLEITFLQDFGTTGNFEVFIENNNSLIHSKSTKGQGRCENQSEVSAVIEHINEYLESL